jgi:uncharacterized DUF497 family protein
VVGEPDEISIEELEWDDENMAHIEKHFVSPADVEAVRINSPLFFRNLPGRSATHVMIGRDGSGRVLYVALLSTGAAGVWKVISAWESRLARSIYPSTIQE